MTEPRRAYHTDEGHYDPETGRYWVIQMEENSAYFTRINDWDSLAGAEQYAQRLNDEIGLSRADYYEILSSALAAHIAKTYPDEIIVEPPSDAEIKRFVTGAGAMIALTFGDGTLETLVGVASHIPFGCTVALLNDDEEPTTSDVHTPGVDVSFVSCDARGVTFAHLDANGNKDGTTGFRSWMDITRIHVY